MIISATPIIIHERCESSSSKGLPLVSKSVELGPLTQSIVSIPTYDDLTMGLS